MLPCTPHPGLGSVVVGHVQIDLATCRQSATSAAAGGDGVTVRVTKDSQAIVFKGKVVLKIHENHKGFPAGSPGPILLEGTSPDRKWILYAIDPQGSASLAADGLTLKAIRATGGRSYTVAATDRLISRYKAEGYEFVTIAEMSKAVGSCQSSVLS